MKRYIKASISGYCPDWLKKYTSILRRLAEKYRVAIDRAVFSDHPVGNDPLPIYYLNTDYGETIYIPGVNDDSTDMFNGRNRAYGKIAKSKLESMSKAIAYVDLADPNNTFEPKQRYQDPRYSYRHNPKGQYVGQYERRDYLGLDKNTGKSQYGPKYWSSSGMTPSNESRARDKSGYKVPSPTEMISRYYEKFPEKITDKIDRLYDRIAEVRERLSSADINSPKELYSTDSFAEAYRTFAYVISEYRNLLAHLDENRRWKSRYSFDDSYRDFAKQVRTISEYLDQVEQVL